MAAAAPVGREPPVAIRVDGATASDDQIRDVDCVYEGGELKRCTVNPVRPRLDCWPITGSAQHSVGLCLDSDALLQHQCEVRERNMQRERQVNGLSVGLFDCWDDESAAATARELGEGLLKGWQVVGCAIRLATKVSESHGWPASATGRDRQRTQRPRHAGVDTGRAWMPLGNLRRRLRCCCCCLCRCCCCRCCRCCWHCCARRCYIWRCCCRCCCEERQREHRSMRCQHPRTLPLVAGP